MSTVQVALVKVGRFKSNNMVCDSVMLASETVASGASDEMTDVVASTANILQNTVDGIIWRVAVAGTDSIHVKFRPTGDGAVTAATGILCPAGGVYEFAVRAIDDRPYIVNA